MKNDFIRCVTAILCFACLGSIAAAASADAEKAVAALEKQWTVAEATNKPELIGPLLADKFIITESEGEVLDRAQFLEAERSNQYSHSDIDDVRTTAFGDTVVVNYRLHQKYTLKGKAFDVTSRETDTWVKMPGGAWQCVASHASTIKKP